MERAIFPVVQIEEEMILPDEPMGIKDKVWCQLPAELGNGRWLFKQSRQQEESIEHLAENLMNQLRQVIDQQKL